MKKTKYYLFNWLFVYGFIHFWALVLSLFIMNLGYSELRQGIDKVLLAAIPAFIISGALVTFMYAKIRTPFDLRKSLIILYIPYALNLVFFILVQIISQGRIGHVIWQFFSYVNISSAPTIFMGLLGYNNVTVTYLIIVMQTVIAIAGTVGLLIQFKKEYSLQQLLKKSLVFSICGVLLIGNICTTRYNQSKDHYVTDYGFAYADGFSSVNLWEYDVQNAENILPVLNPPATFTISELADMPHLDGAEAAFPVYSAFAQNVYDKDVMSALFQEDTGGPTYPIRFTNTIYAFESLVAGDVDIFFGARPSANQLQLAADAGVTLEVTPIGQEAFIFIVSEQNPIEQLTVEQIQQIYSGKITNWKELGGLDERILPFQRPEDSGSQSMMEYFMGDNKLIRPLREEYIAPMGGVYDEIADYKGQKSGIAYSFRFFSQMSGKEGFKILSIDGVPVTSATITDRTYPFVVPLVAVTVKEHATTTTNDFVSWMQGAEGQEIIEEIGYVKL